MGLQGLLGFVRGGCSPEKVMVRGSMPTPNDVRPRKLENIRRTSSLNMVVRWYKKLARGTCLMTKTACAQCHVAKL